MTTASPDAQAKSRSHSISDSERSEHERKRPRLSAKPTEDNMSQVRKDAVKNTKHPTNARNLVLSAIESTGHVPITITGETLKPLIKSPTSKVTINTRPLSSQSQSHPSSKSGDLDQLPEKSYQHVATTDGATDQRKMLSRTVSPVAASQNQRKDQDTISISSSNEDDPEIEVAEVEDFDEDPARTRWTSRYGGKRSNGKAIFPNYIFHTFPFADQRDPGHASPVLRTLQKAFRNGSDNDGDLFQQVQEWIKTFTNSCTEITFGLISEDPDFWQHLPNLTEALLKRDLGVPVRARPQDLMDYFVAYGRLTCLMIKYDVRQFSRLENEGDSKVLKDVQFVSAAYTPCFASMLIPRMPLFEVLNRHHNLNVSLFIQNLVAQLIDSSEVHLIATISTFMNAIGHVLPHKASYSKTFVELLSVTDGCAVFLEQSTMVTDTTLMGSCSGANLQRDISEIVSKAESILNHAVEKQLSWLNKEAARSSIENLAIAYKRLAVRDHEMARKLFATTGMRYTDADTASLEETLGVAWRFKYLMKFMKSGRMELRVYAAETMSHDLVSVYQQYIHDQPPQMDHPAVQFLVRFIRETQLIGYLVGVESHPQIMQRSHNIGGFLCVTNQYTDADTDTIWRAVLDGQDPRTTAEILGLLQRMFQMFNIASLHYLCQKLIDLPFNRYDLKMHQFTGPLLDTCAAKASSLPFHDQQRRHPAPRRLCMRLLREAYTPDNVCSDVALCIRREIVLPLQPILRDVRHFACFLAIDGDEENHIMQEIQSSLREHNDYASGDIQIVTSVMQQLYERDARSFVRCLDFKRLFVDDLANLSHNCQNLDVKAAQIKTQEFEIRLMCLFYLITTLHKDIDQNFVESIWNSLYTNQLVPEGSRAFAWSHLATIMKGCYHRNHVIDCIVAEYLPRLRPQDYDPSILDFVEQSVHYEIRVATPDTGEDEGIINIPGMDRMWKIVLEAPSNTVESSAINFIITQYLDNPVVARCSRASIAATHAFLVDHSVLQVIESAIKLQAFTSASPRTELNALAEHEVRCEWQHFDRSLLFLRRLLEGLKARPQYSPVQTDASPALPEFADRDGDEFDLKLQIRGSKLPSNPLTLKCGKLNTGSELWRYLAKAIDSNHFGAYHMGQQVNFQNESKTLDELRMNIGMLLVNRAPFGQSSGTATKSSPRTSVDDQVMNHFESLYKLLDTDDRLAGEVYSFLSLFPAQPEIIAEVRSMSRSVRQLLPSSKAFKALYGLRTLRTCVEVESFSSTPDTTLLVYSTQIILDGISNLEPTEAQNTVCRELSEGLIECLLLGFRARVPTHISETYIKDRHSFLKQLLNAWERALRPQRSDVPQGSSLATVSAPFDAILEGALHDRNVLELLKSDNKFPRLLRIAILEHQDTAVRSATLEIIYGLTGTATVKPTAKENDFRTPRSRFPTSNVDDCLTLLWTHLEASTSDACAQPLRSQAFFDAMLTIIKRLKLSFSMEQVRQYYTQWAALLLNHDSVQMVGQAVSDRVILNLPKLLLECVYLLSKTGIVSGDRKLVLGLFSRYLYPALSIQDSMRPSKLPVLDSPVRQNLFDLVLALSSSADDSLNLLLDKLEDLVPGNTFELGLVHERSCIRSDAGYAGLRNLSNTCYLNSLVSQLFMNVDFREFILRVNVIDRTKQRLVLELGKVFANMQSSYEKSVDPSCAVDSITTYDGDQIDVAVQMDVDEFFNLLFDRLEGQIIDPQHRQQFKSMYGGQLVQQIKSKECDHISERMEPFSAVQVEIKGKQTLEDSLKAYVEGEVLQGDNKYSCTSCGRHVDAVKRACLKDVPDNLIFNLKRFDYDIMTGVRCKINDEFQFPETLDIAPYTLEHLGQPDATSNPDLFELTGIIVHSGTADSGHYYSFIRQRPSAKSKTDAWVQFNDQEVTPFDPSQIQDCCFGGGDSSTAYYMTKFYSAYMLFYQRVNSIQRAEHKFAPADVFDTVKVELSPDIEKHLLQRNELFLRTHCVQDPSHARFIRQLLERVHSAKMTESNDDHESEDKILRAVLTYVFQISSRWKGLPEFEETMTMLRTAVAKCGKCAGTVLRWLADFGVIEGMILKNPYQVVRKSTANLICLTLTKLQHPALQESTSSSTSGSTDSSCMTTGEWEDLLGECLMHFYKLWETMTRFGRSWYEYFRVLQHCMTKLGEEGALIVLDHGFLERALEVMMIHCPYIDDFEVHKRLRSRYSFSLALREKGRGFPDGLIVTFIWQMLQRVDFNTSAGDHGRKQCGDKLSLSSAELDLLGFAKSPQQFEWLRRIIIGGTSPSDARHIVAYISRQRKLTTGVYWALNKGLNDRMLSNAAYFLHPTIAFVENCRNQTQILDLVNGALDGITTITADYGKEYLEFVLALTTCENEHLYLEPGWLKDVVLENINFWAPPLLITALERRHDIKKDTMRMLQEVLFEPIFTAQQHDPQQYAVLQNYVHKFVAGAQEYIQFNVFDADSKSETMALPTQASALAQVVEHCLQYYDAHDPVQAAEVGEVESCLQMLKSRADIAAETMSATEWAETSSDIAEVSEPDVEDIVSP